VRSRTAFLGIPALLLAAVVGCTSADGARPAPGAGGAQPSYVVPDGAPGFCEQLASATELTELPTSIAVLVTGPDVEARTQVSKAIRELRAVLADARDVAGQEGVAAALDELVTVLTQLSGGVVTDAVRAAVSTGLEQVGAQTQPVCEFPT
jgi:hypothetical protein